MTSTGPQEPLTLTCTMPGAARGQKPGQHRAQGPPVWMGDSLASRKKARCRVGGLRVHLWGRLSPTGWPGGSTHSLTRSLRKHLHIPCAGREQEVLPMLATPSGL